MNNALRTRLSKIRAQVRTLLGNQRGFFIQYEFARTVRPVCEPYPEVEALFARSPYDDFLNDMASHVAEFQSFGSRPHDPVWNRGMFPPLDGAAAFAAVRRFKPRRILEVGSGDSTFYLARAAAGSAEITCIDPEPRRSIEELPVNFIRRVLGNEDAGTVASLQAGDILFIDSSHIMLPGMDVDILFNRCFPRLRPGVLVHLHDIFLPDGYPANWRERNWNEQNALVGWLLSEFFEVVYPGHYVAVRHGGAIDKAFAGFPVAQRKDSGSLWLRKR